MLSSLLVGRGGDVRDHRRGEPQGMAAAPFPPLRPYDSCHRSGEKSGQAESSARCVRQAAAGHLKGWRVLGGGSKPDLFLESPRSAEVTRSISVSLCQSMGTRLQLLHVSRGDRRPELE